MSVLISAAAEASGVLPGAVLHSGPARVLAAFVTINTVMYCALAVAKVLPRLHPTAWFPGSNRRAQERSIHPAGWTPDSRTPGGRQPDSRITATGP
jgi:hypothetical protein